MEIAETLDPSTGGRRKERARFAFGSPFYTPNEKGRGEKNEFDG